MKSRRRPARHNQELWPRPRCGPKLAHRKPGHPGGRLTVEQYLAGKPWHVAAAFHRLAELAREYGPVSVTPAKDVVLFKARTTFAEVRARRDGLDLDLVFGHLRGHPRFHRVQLLSPGRVAHSTRIDRVEDLDDEVAGWLKEAFEASLAQPSPRPHKPTSKTPS
jgi:hypothetical protein